MNGVTIHAEKDISFASEADAVLIGSGSRTRELVQDVGLLRKIKLDPSRQLIGAQCSGTLVLAKLGLLGDRPACTDVTTKPWVIEAGVRVLDQPFYADGNIATAGGCLAQQYLATWVLLRGGSREDAEFALQYVAPVGEKSDYSKRAFANVEPYITATAILTPQLQASR
jgi:transcriptional regulator GlxA family with amidase domain